MNNKLKALLDRVNQQNVEQKSFEVISEVKLSVIKGGVSSLIQTDSGCTNCYGCYGGYSSTEEK